MIVDSSWTLLLAVEQKENTEMQFSPTSMILNITIQPSDLESRQVCTVKWDRPELG